MCPQPQHDRAADHSLRPQLAHRSQACCAARPQLATVGYGDVVAANPTEMIFSMVAIVLGISVFAYTATRVSALMGEMASGENTTLTRRRGGAWASFFARAHAWREAAVSRARIHVSSTTLTGCPPAPR